MLTKANIRRAAGRLVNDGIRSIRPGESGVTGWRRPPVPQRHLARSQVHRRQARMRAAAVRPDESAVRERRAGSGAGIATHAPLDGVQARPVLVHSTGGAMRCSIAARRRCASLIRPAAQCLGRARSEHALLPSPSPRLEPGPACRCRATRRSGAGDHRPFRRRHPLATARCVAQGRPGAVLDQSRSISACRCSSAARRARRPRANPRGSRRRLERADVPRLAAAQRGLGDVGRLVRGRRTPERNASASRTRQLQLRVGGGRLRAWNRAGLAALHRAPGRNRRVGSARHRFVEIDSALYGVLTEKGRHKTACAQMPRVLRPVQIVRAATCGYRR